MEWSELPWDASRRKLRQFAATGIALLLVWASLRLAQARSESLTIVLLGTATVLALLAWLRPLALGPLWKGSLGLTFPVGWLTSRFLICLIYFGILTPIGLGLKWSGYDPLGRKTSTGPRETFWKIRSTDRATSNYLQAYSPRHIS